MAVGVGVGVIFGFVEVVAAMRFVFVSVFGCASAGASVVVAGASTVEV